MLFKIYTITATNSTGNSQITINITIEVALVAPSISYSGSPFTFTDGDSVNITSSNSGGAVASWSISPEIGNGLTFNTSTGSITGTATGTLGATGYTITATNNTGNSQITINITIEAAAVSYPGISSITYLPSDYSTSMINGQAYFERSNNTDKFMNDSFWIGIYPGLNETHFNYMLEKIKKFISLSKN